MPLQTKRNPLKDYFKQNTYFNKNHQKFIEAIIEASSYLPDENKREKRNASQPQIQMSVAKEQMKNALEELQANSSTVGLSFGKKLKRIKSSKYGQQNVVSKE